jgi:hypothetical protein
MTGRLKKIGLWTIKIVRRSNGRQASSFCRGAGRRTHLRMARVVEKIGKGLGEIHRVTRAWVTIATSASSHEGSQETLSMKSFRVSCENEAGSDRAETRLRRGSTFCSVSPPQRDSTRPAAGES